MEMSFGDWEGFTIAQLQARDPQRIAAREHDKWDFVLPGGESYEMVSARMRAWYESLERDTVVDRAWRHRARADRASRHRQAGRRAARSISGRAWSMCSKATAHPLRLSCHSGARPLGREPESRAHCR